MFPVAIKDQLGLVFANLTSASNHSESYQQLLSKGYNLHLHVVLEGAIIRP